LPWLADSFTVPAQFCANTAIERSVGGPCVCALLDRGVDHLSADANARNDDAFNALIGLKHDQDEKNLRLPLVPSVVTPITGLLISVFSPHHSRRWRRRTLPANCRAVRHHGILY